MYTYFLYIILFTYFNLIFIRLYSQGIPPAAVRKGFVSPPAAARKGFVSTCSCGGDLRGLLGRLEFGGEAG
jgi:hypothetical protein